jgi:hypothetical protein
MRRRSLNSLHNPPPDPMKEQPARRRERPSWESDSEAEAVNPFYFAGRCLLFLLLAGWGWRFITASIDSNYAGESILHLVNLPFHEAGHVFFSPFGRFMMVLGGTLGQLLMPLTCAGTFLLKTRDAFAASVALWWTAENVMDIAPYINDARALELILLGGVTGQEVEGHDWEYLLGSLGWLRYDHALAHLAQWVGITLMITALFWGGTLLLRQYQTLHRRSSSVVSPTDDPHSEKT